MGKIKTDRQLNGEFMWMWFFLFSFLGVVCYHAWNISGNTMVITAALVCGVAGIAPLVLSAEIWAYSNHLGRGMKYAWKHYKLVLGLRKHLLDAGIYTTKKLGAVKWAKIPWITIDFDADYKSGTVWIENSIQFNDKLSSIDISPSMGRYVVEQVYLTDDANHYRFEFYDSPMHCMDICSKCF